MTTTLVNTNIMTSTDVDPARCGRVGQQLMTLRDELNLVFPEREDLITQIIYALLTKEHVLVFGKKGTGKSDLATTLFEAITGAQIFSIAMSKFMSEGYVIGMPDVKKAHDDGVLFHRTEGTLIDSHFADFDEILDSSSPLLRVLLGILNERHFKRGRQFEHAKLHTAVGSTNKDPKEAIAQDPSLDAVIDRFLFQCHVTWLTERDDRLRMYMKYLHGSKPSVHIALEDLQYCSNIVTSANQITEPFVVEVFDDVVEKYQEETHTEISDRYGCKLLKLMEANAIMYGRYEVVPEDVLAVQWALCHGGDTQQHEIFRRIAGPIIEAANTSRTQSIDEVQLRLLTEYETKIPSIPTTCSDSDLVALRRGLRSHRKDVEEVKPQLATTLIVQKRIKDEINRRLEEVTSRMDA